MNAQVVNMWLNFMVLSRLHAGYNVGKGFITAEEEAIKLVGCICHNPKIQARLLRASEKNRLTVIKEMGQHNIFNNLSVITFNFKSFFVKFRNLKSFLVYKVSFFEIL